VRALDLLQYGRDGDGGIGQIYECKMKEMEKSAHPLQNQQKGRPPGIL